ncbi:MAG: phosphoribosyl-ATP diphosphatase [Planctomycetia bacterium]|nr:phosphoribosyl-ATP diphosphatase [Planctomycetia bacterium]
METQSVLTKLTAVIESRKSGASGGERSYTRTLLEGGVPKIGAKIMEEAEEAVEAAAEPGEEGRQHLVREAADLVYHLLVLLACRDTTLAEVEAELARRFGVSGIEEKQGRGKPDG